MIAGFIDLVARKKILEIEKLNNNISMHPVLSLLFSFYEKLTEDKRDTSKHKPKFRQGVIGVNQVKKYPEP